VEKPEIETIEKPADSVVTTVDKTSQTTDCNCTLKKYNKNYSTDLIFQNYEHLKTKNDSLYTKWSTDSLKNQIKSIRFIGFDTIPSKYSVFKEVNKLSISSNKGIYGIDIFQKLKTIHFFGSVIDLNTNEKWLNRIEALFGEKTKFTGLNSFNKMSNLNTIYFGFSGFDNFPKDLDKLNCLNEITCGAYMFGKIDLSTLDLSKNKCLQKVEFQCWQNTLDGIPKGMINSKIRSLKISHQKLTDIEKKELKKIKASW